MQTKILDAIHDTFIAITRNVNFHMKQKQLHAFPWTTFNFSCQQVNIVFTKDGICTLVNIVITNPTQAILFPWFYATQGFIASNTI